MHRSHPYTIVLNLLRVLYLIIIPFLRGFINAFRGDIYTWLSGAWIDLSIIAIMIGISVIQWLRLKYSLDKDCIHVQSGILARRFTTIPYSRIVTLSLVAPFLYKPIKAIHLRADTLGGSFKDSDYSVLLNYKQGIQVVKIINSQRKDHTLDDVCVYIPTVRSIIYLALFTSNSLAGIVFIATFISQSGKILGGQFSQKLIGTVEDLTRILAFGIPPAAAMIAYAMILGWIIAFTILFVRYKNMIISNSNKLLTISSGMLTHRKYYVSTEKITFIDIRQTIITKVLKLYSLYICAVGYGKQKDEIACVIATENSTHFNKHCEDLFPEFIASKRVIKSEKIAIMGFIGFTLAALGAIIVTTAILIWLFPQWNSFLLFVGIMSLLPAIAILILKLLDYQNGGISFDGDVFTLRYSKNFVIHKIVIPRDKIAMIRFKQSIFQKPSGLCDFWIYSIAERRSYHRCRGLNLAKIKKYLEPYNIV